MRDKHVNQRDTVTKDMGPDDRKLRGFVDAPEPAGGAGQDASDDECAPSR